MDESACKRGRPRGFDADVALDAALTVFWRNGYEGTSLSDLTAAMGINRPSLYATFGNKESLFRRAMDRYAQRGQALVAHCDAEPTARAFVACLLRAIVDGCTGCTEQSGCFLVQGAMRCSASADAIRKEAAQRRHAMEGILRARFESTAREGELPAHVNPADLASYFAIVIHGLAVHAADGADRATLHRAVDVAMRAWPDQLVGGT